MKRLIAAIKAGYRGWQYPKSVVCIRVQEVRSDGDSNTLGGRDALAYLANRMNSLEEALAAVPELVGAAYSEGYRTSTQDWAEGRSIPEQREQEYVERNLDFIEQRTEVQHG